MKKIHQIWVQGLDHFREKQPEFYTFSQKWAVLFPNYEYKMWSEEQYKPLIAQYSNNLLQVYDKAPTFAAKSDIARYVILWFEGGLYADTDYEPFRNSEYLFQDTDLAIVAMHLTKNKLLFGNFKYNTAWMYATPNHILFQHLLDDISQRPFDEAKDGSFDYVWTVTGPKAFGDLVERLDFVHNPRVRILDHPTVEVADFSTVAITKYNQEEILAQFPYAIGIHRCDASWIKNMHTVKRVFGDFYTWVTNWSDFVHIFLVVLLLLVLPIMSVCVWKTKCRRSKCNT